MEAREARELVEKYKADTDQPWPATFWQIGEWAVDNGLFEPSKDLAIQMAAAECEDEIANNPAAWTGGPLKPGEIRKAIESHNARQEKEAADDAFETEFYHTEMLRVAGEYGDKFLITREWPTTEDIATWAVAQGHYRRPGKTPAATIAECVADLEKTRAWDESRGGEMKKKKTTAKAPAPPEKGLLKVYADADVLRRLRITAADRKQRVGDLLGELLDQALPNWKEK